MEQIGLQAVFEDRDYQAGVKRYVQGNKTAEKSTTDFASVVKTASIVITGVSSAINVAQQSIKYLKEAFDATVGAANQFNGYIEQTMRLTGTGAEETSRLVEAMQKLGIEQGTINTTFEKAAKGGISLSIESIGKLSDEYLELNPGAERASFLMEKFGKSGMDIAEFMELGAEGVEQATSAISDNAVVTEESIEASQKFERSLSALKIQAQLTGVTIGNTLVPVLNEAMNSLNTLGNAPQQTGAAFEKSNKQLLLSTDNYKEYSSAVTNWKREMGPVAYWLIKASGAQMDYSESQYNAIKVQEQYKDVSLEYQDVLDGTAQSMIDYANAQGQATSADLGKIAAYQRLSAMGEPVDITPMLQAEAEAANLVAASFGELTKQQLFNMAAANLNSKAQLQLALDLGILNMDTYNQLTVMGNLDDAYKNGKISTEQYMQGVKDLGYAIDLLKDKTVHVNVVVSQTGGYTGLGYNEDRNRAAGGFVQPGKSYWVGEAGRELFTPTMPGNITSNHNVNNYYNASYNMPGYTSQAQNVVQRSFGIARLLAQ